jgi:outer membrane protein assembly factor BamA
MFIPDALFNDEQKIRDFYESSGHQNVSIHYKLDFQKNSSNLKLQWVLNTGPVLRIASIRIEGNQSTRSDLILNQIRLKEGELLTQQNRSVAKKRLSDLGIFQQTEIESEETENPGWYDIVVRVTENKKYEFQYGGRYNTDDKFGVELRLTDFNFMGRAQSLSLYGRSTLDLPLFRVDYILPSIGTFWDRTRFSVFRDQTDEDVRATISGDLIKIPFEHRQLTFQFQQDYRLWTDYRLIWSFEYGSQEADFEDLASGVPIRFTGTEALFRSAFVADRRDDPLNASRGYFYSINGEYAPIVFGSDTVTQKPFRKFSTIRNLARS